MKRFTMILCAVLLAAFFATSADACTKARRKPVRKVVKAVVAAPVHVLANHHERRVERRHARHVSHTQNACSPEVNDACAPEPKKDKKRNKKDRFESVDTYQFELIGPAPAPACGPSGKCHR